MDISLFQMSSDKDYIYMGVNPKGELIVIFIDKVNKQKNGKRVESMSTCNNTQTCSGFCISVNLEERLIDDPKDI